MSRRYDSHTTTFSPEGRLYQVEYAMEAISQAGAAVGILATDGVVLAAEKRITSKLLDIRELTEKMYSIDSHVAVGVAGITSDANILINHAREHAQQYAMTYQEPMPIEQLAQSVCDLKQSYTQFGGLRPFGMYFTTGTKIYHTILYNYIIKSNIHIYIVSSTILTQSLFLSWCVGVSFLLAGYDGNHGFQLYQSDPSGNYGGWKAKAIGANNQAAQAILKSDYKNGITLQNALLLAIKVLGKTMDTTAPTPDKLEISTIRLVDKRVVYHVLNKAELQQLLKNAESILKENVDKDAITSADI